MNSQASMMTSTMSSTSSLSGTSSVIAGSFVFQKSSEDNFKIYSGSSLSKGKKADPEMNVVFDGNKVDLFNADKKCIATARRSEKSKRVYYSVTLIKRNCPVIVVDRKSSFTLMDGTHCRPQLDDKSYSVVDTRNGLALATFERNTRSFTKFGVLRLFASHLSTDNLTFLFMNVIILIKLQRDRDSYNNLSGII
ncbi:hypothetical protein E3P99_00793 [Wallemia hederae]|uniref:Tubby C-terminal domain-containing protein n=1 Tax=Wallemia hederae TaxID=1540922 RepID=A0A4T0FU94_9BASI|nr:hypothetical protein E3P99_00793 [Wallemia hederae]